MAQVIQAVRGMNDIVPSDVNVWQHVESIIQQLMQRYGYSEIRLPIVESTALFKRSVGESTDIVEKETYTFDDRNGDSLTLRPEGTAVCVRAGIQNGLLANQQQRLWYMGPMFRHERPQKGRYRQFYQLGVETFGMPGPDIDAELLLLTARLWRELGLSDIIRLQLNSLGTPAARADYRQALVDYFTAHETELDEDSQRRLAKNPLRILDSKNSDMQTVIAAAPSIQDYLDDASREHFSGLCQHLDNAGIDYEINSRLVRGLDYYTGTVFEWVTEELGAQGTVCAGGRYDGLVEQLGGKATPAIGFAMGMERLILLLQQRMPELEKNVDVYVVNVGEQAEKQVLLLAEQLRDALPSLGLQMHCGGGSFKSQMKKADKSGANIALILGDDEVANNQVTIKYLREEKPQQTVAVDELINYLK